VIGMATVPPDPYDLASDAARELAARTGVARHDALVVLGSGWAGAAAALGEVVADVPMAQLPGFVPPVALGHEGRLLSTVLRRPPGDDDVDGARTGRDGDGARTGREGDGARADRDADDGGGRVRVLVALGRTHLYEGHGPAPVVHAVRTAAAAGARVALLTNANGSLRPDWGPGTGVALTDHLDLAGASPLTGPRFVDLTAAYSPRLRAAALAAAADLGIPLAEGVYAMLRGPHYETVAEARMLRTLGADVVGMSTVPEVIAAREAGLEVLGLSVVTVVEALEQGAPGVDADEVVRVAARAASGLGRVLAAVLATLPPTVLPAGPSR
jgi:purine-nucleoside phosphorylase